MKRIAIVLVLILNFINAEAQSEVIIKAIAVESIAQAEQFIRNREDSSVKLQPSICPYMIESKIDSLALVVSKEEIQAFLTHENGVVQIVGFWLLAQKTDSGIELQETLKRLLSEEPKMVMTGCADIYQTDLVGEYCYELVTEKYPFTEKLLKLNSKQRKALKPLLKKYKMSKNKTGH
jgi:hypothetical protein